MSNGMVFYTGAHQPHWLWRAGFPLFVSHRQLARKRQLRPALARWALDSGGFTELAMYGRWLTAPGEYVEGRRRYAGEIRMLEDHQRRAVAAFPELREHGPERHTS